MSSACVQGSPVPGPGRVHRQPLPCSGPPPFSLAPRSSPQGPLPLRSVLLTVATLRVQTGPCHFCTPNPAATELHPETYETVRESLDTRGDVSVGLDGRRYYAFAAFLFALTSPLPSGPGGSRVGFLRKSFCLSFPDSARAVSAASPARALTTHGCGLLCP